MRGRLHRLLLGPQEPTRPWDGTMPSSEAHHCWSTGTAPRCRSCGSPGLEAPGQRARPRCRTGPSHRLGDGGREEPQRLPSWLAQGALKRGMVVSTITGTEKEATRGEGEGPGPSSRPGAGRAVHLVPSQEHTYRGCR